MNQESPPLTPTLDALIFDCINLIEDTATIKPNLARLLLRYWFFSMQFDTILPTKPLVLMQGVKGSGKSSFFTSVGLIYHGSSFSPKALPEKVEDFDAPTAAAHFIVWDNVDEKPPAWFMDRLAIIATGGSAPRRTLYTTSGVTDLIFNCFIGLTARTPRFTRDDVADRLLIFTLDRLDRPRSEGQRQRELILNRPAIWREIILYNQWILRAFAAYPLGQLDSAPFSFRMADFADFCWRLSLYAGIETAEACIAAFNAARLEQATFNLNSNPLLEYISIWLQEPINQNRSVSSPELCDQLKSLLPYGSHIKMFDNHRSFGRSIQHHLSSLQELFIVTELPPIANNKRYSFLQKVPLNLNP